MSTVMGQVSAAAEWLERHTSMPRQASQALARLAPVLLAQVPDLQFANLAMGGPPGSGKSTLARLLTYLLNESGRPTARLSLDDYYLSSSERHALARSEHALLRQRGVPGTHDWSGLLHDFDCLRKGQAAGLKLRVFDKSTDEVAPPDQWRSVDLNPCCLIVEGWCIGAPAQDTAALSEPVNDLEREQDPDGAWRSYVNHQLGRYHRDLADRMDRFCYLEVPGWECVIDWRWQQEQELAEPRLQNRGEVADFLAPFERIVRHMQATSKAWADARLHADARHRLEVMQ